MSKEIKVVEVDEVEAKKEIINGIIGQMKSKKISKSSGIISLYETGMEVGDVWSNVKDQIMEDGSILVSCYNMCYNVISGYILRNGIDGGVVRVGARKSDVRNSIIECLEAGLSVKDIMIKLGKYESQIRKVKKEWLATK